MDFYFLTDNDDAPPTLPTVPPSPKALLWICLLCHCLEILFPKIRKYIWDTFRLHLQIWLAPQLTSITRTSTPKGSVHQHALIRELEAGNKTKRSKIVTSRGDLKSRKTEIAELKDLLRKEKAKSASLESKLSNHFSMEESHSLLVDIHDRTLTHQENLESSARRHEQEMTAIKDILSNQQRDLQQLENTKQYTH